MVMDSELFSHELSTTISAESGDITMKVLEASEEQEKPAQAEVFDTPCTATQHAKKRRPLLAYCGGHPCYSMLGVLALGQFLSLLITATGFASSRLASLGIHAPTTQSMCNYILLALVYGSIAIYQRRKLKVQWYYYALLAIVDVEANYLAVKAYQYTTITSVLLLDRGSLLFVLALTWLILKAHYNLGQLGGVLICMVGVVILFISDVQPSSKEDAKRLVKGDVMVLMASFLYAISNVIEEFLSRKSDFIELAAWLGLFGSLISSLQLCILELQEITSIKWNPFEVLPFLGYATSLFTFYTIVPIFLKYNGSTSFNLCLITSDMWAIFIKQFVYHQKIGPLYFVALFVVAIGLITHSFFNKTQTTQYTNEASCKVLTPNSNHKLSS